MSTPDLLEERTLEDLLEMATNLEVPIPPDATQPEVAAALREHFRAQTVAEGEGLAEDRRNSAAAGRAEGRYPPTAP